VSDQDIEIVRDQFQAVNERDFERAMDLYAEDVVLVVHPGFGLETGTFEGKEAVGEWFGNWFRTFGSGLRFNIDEAREIGGVIYLHANFEGEGRSSGAPVRSDAGYLYAVRDGKVVRAQIFGTRDEALAAAPAPE
jgi:ketosteroid isomerase-like protein